jgi:hypothetical protein
MSQSGVQTYTHISTSMPGTQKLTHAICVDEGGIGVISMNIFELRL